MADNNLDIYINLISRQTGEKPEVVLKKITEEVKKTGEETKKATVATEADTKATDKAVSSKKQLHGLLRGLSQEFPVLGRVATFVLNPISLAVAGIAGAFSLWKKRVDELTTSLAGFQMPDVSTDQIARIDAGAAALGRFAVEMAKLQGTSKLVKEDLANVVRTIKTIDEVRKAAGIDTRTQAADATAAAKEAAATRLEMEARARLAMTPGSPEAEAALAVQYKSAAEAALKAQATARGRLGEIGQMQDAPWWQQPYQANKFRFRYGSGTTYDQAREIEQGNISNAQIAIDQYGSFQQGSAARAGQRDMVSSGKAQLEEAKRLRAEAAEIRSQAAVARTERAFKKIGELPGQMAETAAGINAFNVPASITRVRQTSVGPRSEVIGQGSMPAGLLGVGELVKQTIELSINLSEVAKAIRDMKTANSELKNSIGNQRRN